MQAGSRARCVFIGGPRVLLAAVAPVWCGLEDVCLLPVDRCPELSELIAASELVVIVAWPDRLSKDVQSSVRAVLAASLRSASTLTIVVDDRKSAFWRSLLADVFVPQEGWHSAVADECRYFAAHRRPIRMAANADIIRSRGAECAHVHDGSQGALEAPDLTAALAVSLAAVVAQWVRRRLGVPPVCSSPPQARADWQPCGLGGYSA